MVITSWPNRSPIEDELAVHSPSVSTLEFIQRCQVLLGACLTTDYVGRSAILRDCLDACPACGNYFDLAAVARTLYRLARDVCPRPWIQRLPTKRRSHVDSVLTIIAHEYATPHLTMKVIASRLGLTPEYLSRSLARETRHSFPSHLNDVRVLMAIRQLDDGSSLVAVSHACGYPTVGELDRQFSRRLHASPRRVRRALRLIPPQ